MNESGFYVRVLRDGKWQTVDIATLTEDEFKIWVAQVKQDGMLERWLHMLWKWIKAL